MFRLIVYAINKGVTLQYILYSDLRPWSKSKSRVKRKIQTNQRSNRDYKGPVGQELTSYKGTTIGIYAVDGILRYSLRKIDHVQSFAIGIVLRLKVKRKAMQSQVKHHFWWNSKVKANIKSLTEDEDRSTG